MRRNGRKPIQDVNIVALLLLIMIGVNLRNISIRHQYNSQLINVQMIIGHIVNQNELDQEGNHQIIQKICH